VYLAGCQDGLDPSARPHVPTGMRTNRRLTLLPASLFSTLGFLTSLILPSLSLQAEGEPYPGVVSTGKGSGAEAFMDEFMATTAREASVPGALVAIVKDGRLVLLKGYGDAHLKEGQPVDPQRSYFRVGSISKTFVGLGILREIQKGQLSLDQNVGEILPELAVQFDHPVTLKQLITHTAGFDERLIGLGAPEGESLETLPDMASKQYPGQIAPPGTYYNYSNYGYLVLAAVLEKSSGQSFFDYQRELLGVLGMDASFDRGSLDTDRIALSYAKGPDGTRMEMPYMRLRYYPAGSLYATGEAMSRYLLALATGFSGSDAISTDSYTLLVGNLYSPEPSLSGSAFTFYERNLRGLRMVEHAGDWEAFSSLLSFSPDRKTGIFFSTNGSSDPLLREKLMQAFADFLAIEKPVLPEPVEPALSLENYAGSYRYARYEHDGMLKIGGLPMQVDIAPSGGDLVATFPAGFSEPVILRPVEPHLFQSADPPVKVYFHVEDDRIQGVSGTYMVPFYLERISPLEGMQTVVPLTAFAVLTMLACLFLPVARTLFIRFTNAELPDLEPEAEEEERKAFRLLIAAAWAHVLFLLGTQLHMGILQQHIVEGVPRSLEALLYLPYGLLLLTVILAARIPRVWNAFSWGPGLKLFYTIVCIAGVVFFQLLWYWNLLAPVRG